MISNGNYSIDDTEGEVYATSDFTNVGKGGFEKVSRVSGDY